MRETKKEQNLRLLLSKQMGHSLAFNESSIQQFNQSNWRCTDHASRQVVKTCTCQMQQRMKGKLSLGTTYGYLIVYNLYSIITTRSGIASTCYWQVSGIFKTTMRKEWKNIYLDLWYAEFNIVILHMLRTRNLESPLHFSDAWISNRFQEYDDPGQQNNTNFT